MITFFRRALSSWYVLGLLGVLLVGFILSGVMSPGAGGGEGGVTVAKIGSEQLSTIELGRQVQSRFEAARREQPTLDVKTFLAAGAFEQLTDGLIATRAVEAWGKANGFAIGKRLIDAEIAGYPAFRGVTGQFDEPTMRAFLAQQRLSEKDFREGVASDLLRAQVLSSALAPVSAPLSMAGPYASLWLERRIGSVGIIPPAAVADRTPPSDAAIAAAYRANIAAYTRGELRSLRYALVGTAQVIDATKPSELEIATYYKNDAATYAAKDTRDLTQVIAPTQAAAQGIAAAARSGASLQAAAAKAGVEASTLLGQSRADFAKSTTDAVAASVFGAGKGAVTDPVKGAFGWYVVRVDAIGGVAARSLDQARPEIVALLSKQKQQEALADLTARIDDSIGGGASFEETARNNKLTVIETPLLLQTGQAPDNPDWKAPPEIAPLLKSAFAMSADDKPVVEAIVPEQQYALVGIARVVPPTPMPLVKVRDAVIRDIMVKRTADKARALGNRLVAAVNRGVPLAKAIADAGVALPPVQAIAVRQIDLAKLQGQVPAPVRAIFSLSPGRAVLVPGDTGSEFFVTVLEKAIPGDLAMAPGLAGQIRGELSQSLPSELVDQFGRAVGKEVKVQRNADAIAQAKRQFAGQ